MTAVSPVSPVRSTLAVARTYAADLVALRRDLHRDPELGLHLPRTQQRILDALAELQPDLEISLSRELSSVTAVLRGTAPRDASHSAAAQGASSTHRPVVLLRADMDALPVTEDLPHDWVSATPGLMHACGHDLHVAALVGAARILHELRAELAGDVVLMFQPGEESPGGAAPMIAEGLLYAAGRRVDAAYALHVISSEHPRGVWWGRPGSEMAASDEFTIVVRGRGGHGSAPHRTLDPVPVACEIVLALQAMVARTHSIWDPVVVTVGTFHAGTRPNIIGDDATLTGTLRTFSTEARSQAHAGLRRVAQNLAAAHGLTADVTIHDGYPVTVNDPAEFAFAKDTIVDLFGADRWADMPDPEAGS
ncbi:MAG TPA: M20 family metallopeptidase [Dermatophilaceae bacterium]|nr:M20 family metallopeptidase [Dermatophilaceae bacterium]